MGARPCRPQSTQYTGHKPVCGCECHKIRWVAIINSGEYQMRNGLPLKEGVSCEDKVELGQMTEKEYYAICKYIPGENGSEFPQEVVQYLYDRKNINLTEFPLSPDGSELSATTIILSKINSIVEIESNISSDRSISKSI